MFSLPDSTLRSKQIPKKTIFEKFALSASQRQRIDTDIARLDIVAHLSPSTLPAIALGKEIKGIYILQVSLKTRSYSKESLALLARLIPQQMLFVLSYQSEVQLALLHEVFRATEWFARDNVQIPILGLDFDSVWEHLVAQVEDIVLDHEKTLEEQLARKKEQKIIEAQITSLQNKIKKEKQLGKQMDYRTEILKLQKQF